VSGIDLEHLRSWIGREEVAHDVVTAELLRKFHATLDMPASDTAPRLIHFCLAQQIAPTSALGVDGHLPRGGFLPPVPLPRRMWAGGKISFFGDLKMGDAVRRVSRVADVAVKEGRSGPLCFVNVDHVIEVGDAVMVRETHNIVYRDASGETPATAAPAAGKWQRPQRAPASLLFRYSALTFNGHRIHYDYPYTTEVEGYPGLVVHGPLQATWLLHYAAELRGAPPTRFTFRGLSPLFDCDDFALHADDTANGSNGVMKLWTARNGGPVAIAAEAAWD
jgi:3-methylfumaryl-CoA hydratase